MDNIVQDKAVVVTGPIFGVRANEIMLFSQPQPDPFAPLCKSST